MKYKVLLLGLDTIEFVDKIKETGLKIYLVVDLDKGQDLPSQDYLDGRFVSSEIGALIKDPGFFNEVNKILSGIKPSEVLYFDTSQANIDSALRAGIDARLFTDFESMKSIVIDSNKN